MTRLRPANAMDASTVGMILTEFARDTEWMPKLHTGAQDIAHASALIDRGWVTVAESDGVVVAFCARDGNDLDALFVRAPHQGTGIGAALLVDAKAHVDTLELWTFEANEGAQRFYARHGFSEIARTDGLRNDEGLPDIRYQWQKEPV